MKRMYSYQVFYILKYNHGEHLRHIYIDAENAKQAARLAWSDVKEQTGRHAFHITPIRDDCPEDVADRKLAYLYLFDPSARPS